MAIVKWWTQGRYGRCLYCDHVTKCFVCKCVRRYLVDTFRDKAFQSHDHNTGGDHTCPVWREHKGCSFKDGQSEVNHQILTVHKGKYHHSIHLTTYIVEIRVCKMGPLPDILGFRRIFKKRQLLLDIFNIQTDNFVKCKSTFEMSREIQFLRQTFCSISSRRTFCLSRIYPFTRHLKFLPDMSGESSRFCALSWNETFIENRHI